MQRESDRWGGKYWRDMADHYWKPEPVYCWRCEHVIEHGADFYKDNRGPMCMSCRTIDLDKDKR